MILTAKCDHDQSNKPTAPARISVWRLVRGEAFDFTIMTVIALNMFQMALTFEGAPDAWNYFLDLTNYIFTVIFIVEAALKLFAFGTAYFDTAWNRFDFFVVVSSIFDVLLKFLPAGTGGGEGNVLSVGPQLARVLRVLRVSRVLRIAKNYDGLQSLLKTIEMSVQSLFNVFMLLMLIFFMMATLGVFFFKDIPEGDVIDPQFKNFKTFGDGFLLLFAISTGEDWNKLMYDCWRVTEITPLYFIVFIILVTQIMLNLFILVIIEQFEKYYLTANNPLTQFSLHLETFKKHWQEKSLKYKCLKI